MQVYNDADILEKILKDKRKELGPLPEEEDVGSPKLKLSELSCFSLFTKNLIHFTSLPMFSSNVFFNLQVRL